jgi:hypothetical protein
MAYTYESKAEALEIAADMGLDPALVKMDHETGLYGWPDDATDALDGGTVLEGEIVQDDDSGPSTALTIVGGTEHAPQSGGMVTLCVTVPQDQAGELAMKIAKFGRDVALHNEAGTVYAMVRAAEKAARKPVNKPATANQLKIIELCSRPSGANTHELYAGLSTVSGFKGKFNAIGWAVLVDACQRFGFTADKSAEIVNNKAIIRYYLRPIASQDQFKMAAD